MTDKEKLDYLEKLMGNGNTTIGQLIMDNHGTMNINNSATEQQKKEQEVPKDKKTAIMEYVDRLKPVVRETVLPIYDEVWMEILELEEVRSVVFNPGRQHGTTFNRDFVASIIHMMSMKGVVSGNDSQLTELLEPEKGKDHPIRGRLAFSPGNKVKKAVEGVFQKHGLKETES